MKKITIRILTIILLICVSLFFLSCKEEETTVPSTNDNFLIAQVGYDWVIPKPNNISNYTVKIVENKTNGQELIITDGMVHFESVGSYLLMYLNSNTTKSIEVKVVDTEDPRFDKWWSGEWKDTWAANEEITISGIVGETFDMKDYFKCEDNSGYVDVTFKVLRGGVDEVNLTDGSKFVIENTDFYLLTATAKDASNNYTFVKYKMVLKNYSQPDTESDYSFTSNNKDGYSAVCIGIPEGAQRGDAYSVSFKLKVNGTITTNAYGGAFIRAFSAFNVFTGNDQTYTAAPDGWVEVTMPNVVCVTAHDVYDWIVLGFKRQLNAPTLDTNDSTTVGIYLLGFNVDNGTTIGVKDVTITKISGEEPEPPLVSDADYSFTSNNKDGYSAVCIGLPEGAQRGDAYSVSFKLKVNGTITTNAYGGAFIRAFSAFNVFTGNDQTYTAAPDGWVEVTMPNVVCVTAHDVYDWIVLGLKRQLNAPTLDLNDNTTVGIYLLGFNVDNGTTIEIKDVVVTSAN